jgi:signal transduction histidine kinase
MSLDLLESFCASDAGARLQRNVAREGAWQMVRVIEDVLELSRHRRGKLESPQVVDLIEIIDGAVKCTSHLMKLKNHTLTTSLPGHRVSLYANSTQLQQVLTNLLTNAAKYTDPGGHIRLTAECCMTTVVLRIADNGNGIATEQLPFLFEPFWQATETLSKSMRGLGLGLSLVKMLVELNGGSIGAQSQGIGTGAEFTIRLPISLAVASADRPELEVASA